MNMPAEEKTAYTHRVAVNAYILKDNKFLLLKRSSEPRIWAPPGGRLQIDEDPVIGLQREVKEETNLNVEALAPANTWFGLWKNNRYLLSIDYVVRILGGEIKLSSEHTDYAWVSIAEMQAGEKVSLDSEIGFKIEDFQNAKRLINMLV
jgi:ADP-ribose pyrophosphatase YjhB (NUDIX family)